MPYVYRRPYIGNPPACVGEKLQNYSEVNSRRATRLSCWSRLSFCLLFGVATAKRPGSRENYASARIVRTRPTTSTSARPVTAETSPRRDVLVMSTHAKPPTDITRPHTVRILPRGTASRGAASPERAGKLTTRTRPSIGTRLPSQANHDRLTPTSSPIVQGELSKQIGQQVMIAPNG